MVQLWPSLVFTFLESEEFIHQQGSGSWSLLLVSFQRLHTFFTASEAGGHFQMEVFLFAEKVGAKYKCCPFAGYLLAINIAPQALGLLFSCSFYF